MNYLVNQIFNFFVCIPIILTLMCACQTSQANNEYARPPEQADCPTLKGSAQRMDASHLLDHISILYREQCYHQVIHWGHLVLKNNSDKHYSISAELASVVMPDGTLSSYVLESYERTYLAFLMAASFEKVHANDSAEVELRRSLVESQALLYNYGEDPINNLLQAVMWETIGETHRSRSHWQRSQELMPQDTILAQFTARQILSIDEPLPSPKSPWKIYGIKKFPHLDWEMSLQGKNSSFYEFIPEEKFLDTCQSSTGIVISTQAWLKKIEIRYSPDYHPLLNAKSWLRLPIGLLLGATTVVAGSGIALGGCGIDAAAEGNGKLCKLALQGGFELVAQSGNVVDYVLKPDMRHWRKIPGAFLLTRATDLDDEECYRSQSPQTQLFTYLIYPSQ